MDIMWAAIGGGVGALIGSLLGTVLGRFASEKWRRNIIIAASVALAIIGGRVAASLYEDQASAPAAIEAQLLADHEVGPLMQSWRAGDPASYQALLSRLSIGARAGQDEPSLLNAARAQMLEAAKLRFAHLDDAHTVELIHIVRSEFEQLATTHPQTCKPMFMGESYGDVTPYISADVRGRELAVLRAAFQANLSAPQNALSGKQLDDAISNLFASMRLVVGDDVSLLANGADITGHESSYCHVAAALFAQMEAMPSAQAASLMRGLRGAS